MDRVTTGEKPFCRVLPTDDAEETDAACEGEAFAGSSGVDKLVSKNSPPVGPTFAPCTIVPI